MRPGLFTLCGLLLLPNWLPGQSTSAPTIVTQPTPTSVYVGDSATLSTSVDGTPPIAFQWYKNFVAITGATNTAYTVVSAAAADTAVYYLVATNAHGSAQSFTVLLSVLKRAQTITFNPATTTTVAGSRITLNATASSGLPVSYGLVSGAASLSGNFLVGSGGNVVVRAIQSGNATFEAAEPVEHTFSFIAGGLSPFLVSPPADQTVNAGSSVTFQGAAIGTPAPTYQWQKDGVDLPGATGAALSLTGTTLDYSGRYTLVATNLLGSASASATLTVRAAPVIVAPPASQQLFAGERAAFAVSVIGFPAPTYQWRKNGATIAGATNSTFTLTSATSADAGRYEVVATNLLGSATSPPATLTVTTRDFSGAYFGQLAGGGAFGLYVRRDRTAVFLAHISNPSIAIMVNSTVELSGNFSVTGRSLGAESRPFTLRGTITDTADTVAGTISELGIAFSGSRHASASPVSAAGYYQGAMVNSASGRAEAIVGPSGESWILLVNATTVDSAQGTLGSGGRLTSATAAQAALDLQFDDGTMRGTLRAGTETSTVAGAIDGVAGSEHLVNLSIRAITSPGAATLITGFVVTGTNPKQVLIRASGPTLAQVPFNVPNVLADPALQVFRGSTPVAQNDDWGTPAANVTALTAAATRAGAFPFRAGSADAALLTTLTPGAYSVAISGGTGTTLAEVYEVLQPNESPGTRRLANLSARGLVTPTAAFVAGFVISGSAPQRVLIRGIGPSLGAPPFNLAGALPNPQLTLFRGPTAVKSNDDWFRDPEAALLRDAAQRAGAFALGASSLDAAMLIYLEPGSYTVQVSGPPNANAPGATGLALIEVYESAP
jgi:hypothetical protein